MVKSFSRKICCGDRILYLGQIWGTITSTDKGICPYEITWDKSGKTERYSRGEINRGGFEIFPPEPEAEDIEEEELSLWNLNSEITAQVLALDSPSQDSGLDSSSLDSAKLMTTAETFSPLDIQPYPSTEISKASQNHAKKQKSSQVRPRASRSVSKAKDSELVTKETVSPHSLKRLKQLDLNFSALRTCEDSSLAPIAQDTEPGHTSTIFAVSFAAWDSDLNGESSPADTLEAPSLESGYFWLASPGALSSSNSRAPGQSKLENQLKQLEAIAPGECINPIYLKDAFTIPLTWLDPLESRTAAQLLGDNERRSETALTRELQPLPSQESSTSTRSLKTEEELTPVDESAVGKHFWCDRLTVVVEVESIHNWRETPKSPEIIKGARCRPWWLKDSHGSEFPECLVLPLHELVEIEEFSCPLPSPKPEISLSKSKQSGSIYQYTANKPDKLGTMHTYPKVEGERQRSEDTHWYWGFSYVEKVRGKWCDRSCAIPRKKLSAVRAALRDGKPYTYIIQEVLGK